MQDYQGNAPRVVWGGRLEDLASGLLSSLQETWRQGADPFAKVCIVVNDHAAENWLKEYLLLELLAPQVFMNITFVTLPELLNDWLGAQVHGQSPRERHAAQHPYGREILAWRIYGLLQDDAEKGVPDFPELLAYVGQQPEVQGARRYALASQLARLYDDYLEARFMMLRQWEEGNADGGWQARLYRTLAAQEPQTYARDYEEALRLPATRAFDGGFPRYLAVHLFDVPFIAEPALRLLQKFAEAVPMTFWTWNPARGWLGETPALKSVIRALRQRLQEGRLPAEEADLAGQELVLKNYDSPDELLLAALAGGGRALIGAQAEMGWVDAEDVLDGDDLGESLASLERISVHSTFSPRRELEAVREGLRDFFQRHQEGVTPRDVRILCADWETYAPIAGAVFAADASSGDVPVALAGTLPGQSPLVAAFESLLEFRRNRFEASAVFALLQMPAICRAAGLDEGDTAALRELVGKANIRWGLDDADVAATLKAPPSQEPYPFTWQRGLERLAGGMLYGDFGEGTLPEIDGLAGACPVAHVEGEQARRVAALWSFVQRLSELRHALAAGQTRRPPEWQGILLHAMEFFALDDEEVDEGASLRHAICQAAEDMRLAGRGDSPLEAEPFLTAVFDHVQGSRPLGRGRPNAVTFAPLNASTAMPARFVWICGLNEGRFPSIEQRTSFDLLGSHPCLLEVDARARDAFALLKAALAARQELAFSYVGSDIRTKKEIAPSVLLNDLLDYLERQTSVKKYTHPLHAYSAAYFLPDNGLPPTYSQDDYAVAKTLQEKASQAAPASSDGLVPFPLQDDGVTEIDVDDLADFFGRPCRFLLRRRLGVANHYFDGLSDEEAGACNLDRHLTGLLKLTGKADICGPSGIQARLAVEHGEAPSVPAAQSAIDEAANSNTRLCTRTLKIKDARAAAYSAPDVLLADAYRRFEDSCEAPAHLEADFTVAGHPVRLTMAHTPVRLGANQMEYVFFYENAGEVHDATRVKAWLRHLAGHAAGRSFLTVFFCTKDSAAPHAFAPLAREEARTRLQELLETATEALPPDFLLSFEKADSPKEDTPFRREELMEGAKECDVTLSAR